MSHCSQVEKPVTELCLKPNFNKSVISPLSYSSIIELCARSMFVGIFVIENCSHITHFQREIVELVLPALFGLQRNDLTLELSSCFHALCIASGLVGSVLVIVSGFFHKPKTRHFLIQSGTNLMIGFLLAITWVWWFNREGKVYWEVTDAGEKKLRYINLLKNISICGSIVCFKLIDLKIGSHTLLALDKR